MKTSYAVILSVALMLSGAPCRALTNGLALRPQMGWAPWNVFAGNYNGEIVRQTADAMATNGMLAAGYDLITIDVGIATNRDGSGYMLEATNRFPGGIRALRDYCAAKGFRFGVYSCAVNLKWDPVETNLVGSIGYETQDAEKFAEWGADYLKYDFVGNDHAKIETMRAALAACGRPIIYMLSGGYFDTTKPLLANQWRCGEDIGRAWVWVVANIQQNQSGIGSIGPGRWSDPDMMEIGCPELSDDECRSHFALWCMSAAPLIIGWDVRNMAQKYKDILCHPELIAIDQDPAGVMGRIVSQDAGTNWQVWVKPLGFFGTEKAIAFFNRSGSSTNITVNLTDAGFSGQVAIRDVWARADLGNVTGTFTTNVVSHGTAVIRVRGQSTSNLLRIMQRN